MGNHGCCCKKYEQIPSGNETADRDLSTNITNDEAVLRFENLEKKTGDLLLQISYLLKVGDDMNEKITVIKPQSEEEKEEGSSQEKEITNQEDKSPIKRYWIQLTGLICTHVDEILAHLYQDDILNSRERLDLMECSLQSSAKAEQLLSYIQLQRKDTYYGFYKACRECQLWEVADILYPENSPHNRHVQKNESSDCTPCQVNEEDAVANAKRMQEFVSFRDQLTNVCSDVEGLKRKNDQIQRIRREISYLNRVVQDLQRQIPKEMTEMYQAMGIAPDSKDREGNEQTDSTKDGKKKTMASAIGIDLGTCYSCMGILQNGKVEIIANDRGQRTTPSYVAFFNLVGEDVDIIRFVGEDAFNQATLNPSNTIFCAARLIGRKFSDASVQFDMKHWPFRVVEVEGYPKVRVEYKEEEKLFSPEELITMLLKKIKEMAEAYLGQPVTDAVIAIPTLFNYSQRRSIHEAGVTAGFNVLRILNGTSAVALAYDVEKKLTTPGDEKHVLIFDLGGGNFSVTIVTVELSIIEVKSTSGDSHLGGEDFDSRLVSYFAEELQRQHGSDVINNAKVMSRLRLACEKVKRTLSTSTEASLEIDNLVLGIDISYKITRAKFEELCGDLFKKTIKLVELTLSDAKLNKSLIQEIILVGGSSRIPKIQELLSNFFSGKEFNFSINPDEAVAHGAAVLAAILTGDQSENISEALVLEAIPFSLGVETENGMMMFIVKRCNTIPTLFSQQFTTHFDNQPRVDIKVYEGESAETKDNNLLGCFQLSGIPPAPRGVPKIRVTFSIDANGILTVTALDLATENTKMITITKCPTREELESVESEPGQYPLVSS